MRKDLESNKDTLSSKNASIKTWHFKDEREDKTRDEYEAFTGEDKFIVPSYCVIPCETHVNQWLAKGVDSTQLPVALEFSMRITEKKNTTLPVP